MGFLRAVASATSNDLASEKTSLMSCMVFMNSSLMLHQVITTEKVPFTYRVAGLGSRFLAWLVDAGMIVILGTAGFCAGIVLETGREGMGTALILLWLFTLTLGYFLVFEMAVAWPDARQTTLRDSRHSMAGNE